ncbi:MAG: GNAT family N-acetyltransferase [Planctomycetia bacterium]|nr:GNAT family N-acetyltransferase [Planctomycetia bacterium]
MPALAVRAALPDDIPLLHTLICELADYERLRHAVVAVEADLRAALFGPRPYCEALLGTVDDEPLGFALYLHNYSTFVGRPGLYLEDLYVRPAARGVGLGKLLLKRIAEIAVERRCGRVEWTALDWNEPAIRFYEGLGAKQMTDWRLFRLSGDELATFGKPE